MEPDLPRRLAEEIPQDNPALIDALEQRITNLGHSKLSQQAVAVMVTDFADTLLRLATPKVEGATAQISAETFERLRERLDAIDPTTHTEADECVFPTAFTVFLRRHGA